MWNSPCLISAMGVCDCISQLLSMHAKDNRVWMEIIFWNLAEAECTCPRWNQCYYRQPVCHSGPFFMPWGSTMCKLAEFVSCTPQFVPPSTTSLQFTKPAASSLGEAVCVTGLVGVALCHGIEKPTWLHQRDCSFHQRVSGSPVQTGKGRRKSHMSSCLASRNFLQFLHPDQPTMQSIYIVSQLESSSKSY